MDWESQSEKTKAFLNEIVEVCKKHNLSISHEDYHGAFVVEPFGQKNIDWLLVAHENVDRVIEY